MASEEKMKILKMIQEGKISVEEGAKLLEALEDSRETGETVTRQTGQGKSVKILVTDRNSDTVKVNLKLPLGIARFMKNLIPARERMKIEDQGIDLDSIFANLESGAQGKIIEFEDEKDNNRVEIWIE